MLPMSLHPAPRTLTAHHTPAAPAARALRRTTLILACCGVAAVAACGGDGSTSPTPTAAGSYELMEVEGTAVPVTLHGGEDTLVIRGGTLDLSADNQFDLELEILWNGQSGSIPLEGDYTVDGGNLEFDAVRNDLDLVGFEGELDGDELAVSGILGLEYLFERDGSAHADGHRANHTPRP